MINWIKRAIITLSGKDDKTFPQAQVSYLGKTSDIEILWPYGMAGNLPQDAIVLMFSVDATEDNRSGIGNTPTKRIKNLPEGEVVFYHPGTKSKIHFKNNGNILIEIPDDVDTGDLNLTIKGNVNIDSPLVNLGIGGEQIARKGDPVQCVVGSGSSAGTWPGTITDGGVNKSL